MSVPHIIYEEPCCDYQFRVAKLARQEYRIDSYCQLCRRWFPVIEADYPGFRHRLTGRWIAAFDLRRLRRWCSESCKQKAKRRAKKLTEVTYNDTSMTRESPVPQA